jgi:hypothetical protein
MIPLTKAGLENQSVVHDMFFPFHVKHWEISLVKYPTGGAGGVKPPASMWLHAFWRAPLCDRCLLSGGDSGSETVQRLKEVGSDAGEAVGWGRMQ